MQFQCRQSGQIHHRHAEALQHQAVFAFAALQLPAADDRRQTRACHGQVTHFHRHMNPLGGIAQEERQAEEQHHDTGFQQWIAAQEPSNNRIFGEFEAVVFVGGQGIFRRPLLCGNDLVNRADLFGIYLGGFGNGLFRRPRFRFAFGFRKGGGGRLNAVGAGNIGNVGDGRSVGGSRFDFGCVSPGGGFGGGTENG